MAFSPRQFSQILDDMIAYVRAHTTLTDFNPGSAIRTILESAALEDDEQYFQMVQLLDAFNIFNASGDDLEARVSDAGLFRQQPQAAAGTITVQDGSLETSTLSFDTDVSDTTIIVEDSAEFPTSGYPYTIRIGEGTVSVEDISVSNNNTATNTLTVSSLQNAHSIGDRVSLVSGAADITLSSGILARTRATGNSVSREFVTVETGIIVNGDYESTPIRAKAVNPGSAGNVGSGRIVEFSSSPPLDGGLVTNKSSFSGGSDLESDEDLRDRYLTRLQSLSKGTPLSLKEAALGTTDPVTGQTVVSASVLERFSEDEVIVYIDDGAGLVPEQVTLARDAFRSGVGSGVSSLPLNNVEDFPDEGFVVASPEDSNQIEILEFTSVNRTSNDLTLSGSTSNAHDSPDEVALVDVVSDSTEAGQRFYQTLRSPIVKGSERVWVESGGSVTLQSEGNDYVINPGTGQIEFLSTLTAGSRVAVNYSYYTGLIATVQRIITGDSDDEANFPGENCASVRTYVEAPTIRRINVNISIVAQNGFDEADLSPVVQEALENYISSLGIGQDVIRAEIIERAMDVTGVLNVSVKLPTGDITILENELPIPFNANGDSLISVA